MKLTTLKISLDGGQSYQECDHIHIKYVDANNEPQAVVICGPNSLTVENGPYQDRVYVGQQILDLAEQ